MGGDWQRLRRLRALLRAATLVATGARKTDNPPSSGDTTEKLARRIDALSLHPPGRIALLRSLIAGVEVVRRELQARATFARYSKGNRDRQNA